MDRALNLCLSVSVSYEPYWPSNSCIFQVRHRDPPSLGMFYFWVLMAHHILWAGLAAVAPVVYLWVLHFLSQQLRCHELHYATNTKNCMFSAHQSMYSLELLLAPFHSHLFSFRRPLCPPLVLPFKGILSSIPFTLLFCSSVLFLFLSMLLHPLMLHGH